VGGTGVGGTGVGGTGVGGTGVGGTGVGGTAGSTAPDPVAPGAQPPPDPNLPPSPSAALTVLAFSQLFVGETDRNFVPDPQAWKQYGYNLDGIISTKTGSNHCQPVQGAIKSSVQTDGNDGIDNSFGANLIPIIGALADSPSTQVTQSIQQGDFTVLLRMTNYNVGQDDSAIDAAIYGGAPRGAPPLWNGSDPWPVTAESVVAGNINQPLIVVPNTYVSSGTLVTSPSIGTLHIPLGISGFLLPLTIQKAVVTMQISGVGSTATGQNGVIAGILDTEELILEFKKIAGGFDPSLCSSNTFESIAMQIRQASDIMKDGSNGDPSKTCDAISIGLGFSAQAVVLGGVAPPNPPPPDPCAGN
jgi:hypothetical protein